MSANELGTLDEVNVPPEPLDPFDGKAANRLEQDVLMATNGIRPRTVMQRIARYKKYMTQPAALQMDIVQKYKDEVVQAAAASWVVPPYVAGDEIQGDALRSFSGDPIITGPLVCQLCEDTSFVYDADFAAHKEKVHSEQTLALVSLELSSA